MGDTGIERPQGGKTARDALALLLTRVADGDQSAFEELYRLTAPKLFGVCLRIVAGRQEAEDVLQDAYVSIWQRSSRFDPARGSALGWLIALARNRAIDRVRASARRPAAPSELMDEVPDPAPIASEVMAEESERVHTEARLAYCVSELDPGDAGYLRQAFTEGLTYAEVASRAGRPLATVKSRIRRALIRLRECLS